MCVSKHGFSRHSQALFRRRLQAGRGTRGSRKSPNSVGRSREEAWPGSSWAQTSPFPRRSGAPTGLLPAFLWQS